MKFLRLDLTAYGPFTQRSLELPAQGPDLHIVYGPNEAGKSTTLRAITGLLYGIEAQTGDAHLHTMNELRVGATLRHSSGAERSFVRKKGRQGTLLDGKGTPIDEAQLRAWLSVADRDHFAQMFGLSHDQLRRAGAALADAKTDVGRMLFGASLDGTTLHQTLLRLDADAERLLSSGGSAGSITKALVAYRQHAARARDLALPAKDWQKVEQELADAEGKRAALSTEVVRIKTAQHRLERVKRALPWLRQRDDARSALAETGDAARLPADLGARRSDLLHALDLAETQHRRAEAEAARTRRELEGLQVSDALLAAEVRLKQLRDDLGKHKDERQAWPGIQKEIVAFRGEQRELLGQIGRSDLSPRNVASIRVDDATLERVRVLQRQDVEWQTALQGLRTSLAAKRPRVAADEAALGALAGPTDTAVLRATCDHLRPDRALPQAIGAAEANVARLDGAVTAACDLLAPWRGAPEAASALRVPAEDVIRRFEADLDDLDRTARDLGARREGRSRELDDLRARLRTLAATGEPPTEVRLAEARVRRDLGWERVRLAWAAGATPSMIDDAYAADTPLVAAYTAAARVADELADALRRESERAAEFAGLRRDEAAKLAELDALDEERARHEAHARQRLETWRALWSPCGFEPMAPREMLSWRGRHATLLDTLRLRSEASADLTAKRRAMSEQQESLHAALSQAGAPAPAGEPWLPLLLRVERTLEDAAKTSARRDQLARAVADGRQELASLDAQVEGHMTARAAWSAQWEAAVARLGLGPEALPEEAAVVMARLSELFRLEDKCVRQEARLKAIEKQMQGFEEAVAALVAEYAPALTGTAAERAEALLTMRDAALGATAKRDALLEQLAGHERDLDEAAGALGGARQHLDALLHEAGVTDDVALRHAIERAAEERRLDGLVAEAERHLAVEGEGWSVDALARAAQETDSDSLEASLVALDEELKEVESRQREQGETVGALRERQSKFAGAEDAASALSEAHEHLAQASLHADRYARIRLATALLRRGIESYRQKNEGAILRRAGSIFESLTLGRYQSLRVVFEGERARLVCMRGSEVVDVKDALSDGTLDQLYLSLRFASLEQHLEAQEPMPLVLDDIFIHFDDERTVAGLCMLAEFAQRTQVLLLTHHARNLDLARRALDAGSWREHRLDPPAGVAAGG